MIPTPIPAPNRAYHLSGSARKRPRGAAAGAGSDAEAGEKGEKAKKRLRGGRQSAAAGGSKEEEAPPPSPSSPGGGKKPAMPSAEAEQAVLQARWLGLAWLACPSVRPSVQTRPWLLGWATRLD